MFSTTMATLLSITSVAASVGGTSPNQIFNPGIGVRYRDPNSNDTFSPININNWFGHMGYNGDILIFPRFDWTDYFYDDLACAVANGRTGFLDQLGN